jgi:hypothetical protein
LLVGWFVGAGWLAGRAASRRVTQGTGFGESLQGAFGDARPYLAFLPVIGRVFAYKRKD